jgi:hypothetical protein
MKQIAKTPQVLDRLRASFGADVAVENLPVYEAALLNMQPLRKTSGLYKGARVTAATFDVMAHSVNQESIPLQLQHDTEATPTGRVFYCESANDELRGLFTVTDPAIQEKIDNGTIDQVSVGYLPAHINCSACGFDYLGGGATFDNLWTQTCPDEHVIGEEGVFAWIDGCNTFMELSLVGKGAAIGAKIIGPSDSLLQGNEQYRLAASARGDGFGGLRLTATPKEKTSVDLTEVLAKLTATTTEKAELAHSVTTLTAERDSIAAALAAAEARTVELEASVEAAGKDLVAEAVAALQAQAKAVLTAVGKADEAVKETVSELVAQIAEHKAKFTALLPTGPVSLAADADPLAASTSKSTAAFRTVK